MYEKLKVATADGVAVLTLNDPATLNAAGLPLMADLSDALERIAAGDIEARCVVITGEGRGFCSGANLQGREVQNKERDSGASSAVSLTARR